MSRKSLLLRLGLLGILALPAYLYSAASVKEHLIASVRTPPKDLPGKDIPAKRRRLVRINPSWLVRSDSPRYVGPQTHHVIQLFPDTKIVLVVERSIIKEKGRFTLIGYIEGVQSSRVILSFYKGAVGGVFLIPGIGSFRIQSTAKGLHWIIEEDPEANFDCKVGERDDT